jgi:hypothetical protein
MMSWTGCAAARGVTFVLAMMIAGVVLPVVPADAAAGDRHLVPDKPGVVRGGDWHLRTGLSGGPASYSIRHGGHVGEQVLLCDANGDGMTTPVVVRGSSWFVRNRLSPSTTTTSFRYGRDGDIPVCGDWNGDGREGPGIVRGNFWHLNNSWTGGRAAHSFRYGREGDHPVVGDWNGDGRDAAGIVRGRWWHLVDHFGGGVAQHSFAYGRSDDTPLVGDWNGDGLDTPAIIRGNTWYLRHALSGGAADHSFRYGSRTDDFVVWQSAAPTSACPGARPIEKDPTDHVVPPAGLDRAARTDDDTRALRRVLVNANRYLLGPHRRDRYVWRSDYPYLPLLGDFRHTEHAVRLPAMEAFSLAVGVRTSAHSDGEVGAASGSARAHAAWLTQSVACQHVTADEGGWGDAWQSAMWAYFAGFAGWLLWEDLDAADQLRVARMVEYEANRFLDYEVPYWFDAAGNEIFIGDTKAEENSWNAKLLQLATAMMPDHPNWDNWQRKNVELLVSSFAAPSDLTNEDEINGQAVADWVDGWNVLENGTLENHRRINPDYMTSVHQAWSAALTYALAGMPVPEAAFHNGALVYGAYTNVVFAAPPYALPGGTMFNGAEVYYPEGDSWGTVRRINFLTQDVLAEIFGKDGKREHGATHWKRLRLEQQLALQDRFDDGRSYTGRSEFTYAGREEYTAQMAAMAWLATYVDANLDVAIDGADYSVPLPVEEEEPEAEAPDPDDPDAEEPTP